MPKQRKSALLGIALLALLIGAAGSPATARDRAFRPTGPGTHTRYDGWNGDGAPRPPAMWRGHGGAMWADHYHACRKRYGARYNPRTDEVRLNRGRRRCAL